MRFFYSASSMGYGDGYRWHKKYNFPNFLRVTRTITCNRKIGLPFAVLKFRDSVWNKVGLHNIGLGKWLSYYYFNLSERKYDIILSIAGFDSEIEDMVSLIESVSFINFNFKGIELNFSCPNIKSFNNKKIPKTKYPLYLKLNHLQDPYEYDLDNIEGIRLNSVPTIFGGLSGKAAKDKNWECIRLYIREGLNIAGCSFSNMADIFELNYMGCKEIGIGSVMLTNPDLVERLDGEVFLSRLKS